MCAGSDRRKIDAIVGKSNSRLSVEAYLRRRIARIHVNMIAHAAHDYSKNTFGGDRRFDHRRSAGSRGQRERETAGGAVKFQRVIAGRNFVEAPLRVLQIDRRLVVERDLAFLRQRTTSSLAAQAPVA